MNTPKLASSVVAALRPQSAPMAPSAAVAIDPSTRAVIEDLFDRLKGIYPAWKQAWPTDRELNAAKREWLAEFMRAGIRSIEQIQHGLRLAAQNREAFVPAVGVFIGWCFAPEAFGLPSLERAYAEAMRKTHASTAARCGWSHPAVYHAAVAVGFFHLQRLERKHGLQLFERKYLEQCRAIGRGETLAPAPVAALPEQAGPSTPEVGREALAALRSRVRGGSSHG